MKAEIEREQLVKVINKMIVDGIDELATILDCNSCKHIVPNANFNNYPCNECIVKTDIICHWEEDEPDHEDYFKGEMQECREVVQKEYKKEHTEAEKLA